MTVEQRADKSFSTTDLWWDCECEADYIHSKSTTTTCPDCGTSAEDQPDSRVDEVLAEYPDSEV